MKKSHLIALIMIAVALGIFVIGSKDISTYATFDQAIETQSRVKISGELAPDKDITYDPVNNPNTTSFYMVDARGKTEKVLLKKPKPQDFELSEQVVVTGRYVDDQFVADEVLLKCPSKYKEEELDLRSES